MPEQKSNVDFEGFLVVRQLQHCPSVLAVILAQNGSGSYRISSFKHCGLRLEWIRSRTAACEDSTLTMQSVRRTR